jgi:uncharacterized protein (TIGR02118 family)
MIKLVFVIRRRKDLSPEEFHRYWLEEHAPLARPLLESLGARRYVQTHTLDTDLNGALAEVWWDSLDALAAVFSSEEGQRASETLIEDEAKFIDFERSSLFLTEEHPIIEG